MSRSRADDAGPPAFPQLLRVRQAATLLSLSVNAVYDLVRSKKIESFRLTEGGDGIRIDRAEVARYLESCRTPVSLGEPNPDAIYVSQDEIRRAQRRKKRDEESARGMEIVHLKNHLPKAWRKGAG